ncbi:uncharacterized protein LOC135960613 [Calliphora vicina]|uniref:uncharacterized protein LOC135960613 n=1 Tax=Calliphora vicina TaxID=7373 RepID=UPI00325AEBBB
MIRKICAIGCPPGNNLYKFPTREKDEERRKLWLDYFDMEEPNIKDVFACDRHFSHYQATPKGIRRDAVPDVPIIYNNPNPPFRRKPKSWRQNVTVVTPRDPEYIIYRKQTGIFAQNVSNKNNNIQPKLLHEQFTPFIKTVSSSKTTQTNTRICGSVQISEFVDEYRLNCFYCCEIFPLEMWSNFVDHLKQKHFEEEEAFKCFKYLSEEHDYTPIGLPSTKGNDKLNVVTNSPTESLVFGLNSTLSLLEQPVLQEKSNVNSIFDPIITVPPLQTVVIDSSPPLPTPMLLQTVETSDKSFSMCLADKLIKLLDETVLNPNFQNTEKQNMTITNNIEILNNFIESGSSAMTMPTSAKKLKRTTSSKNKRPIYSLSGGQQNILSRRNSSSYASKNRAVKRRITAKATEPMTNADYNEPITSSLPHCSNNENTKPIKKRIVQQSSKNTFENIYKTMKTKPKVISSGIFYLKDISSNILSKRQASNKSALSRCLKRANTIEAIEPEDEEEYKPFSIESLQLKPTELVFEYTPRVIIDLLLDRMQQYPVLWEFHDKPFNEDYNKAIEDLCQIINVKWSLNIDSLKMRRSINHIIRFYRYMLPCQNIKKFADYFEKCSLFLPPSVDEIPQARCFLCCLCYKNDIDLRQHLIEEHESLNWPYKCRHCTERFRESDEYELHKRLPHYVEIFTCQLCNKKFSRHYLYQKHLELHKRIQITETGKYKCNICSKEFKSNGELKSHKIYHGERKHKCNLCSKSFFNSTGLMLHLKRHRKELDFICEVCGKGFIHQAYLNEHMEKHTGAKVTCNICNLKLRKCSLMRHLRTVHVACEGTIETTFRAKNHNYKRLLRPMPYYKRTKKPKENLPRQYVCKICKIPFDRLKFLKDHNVQFHSDVEKWPCKVCGSEFRRKHNLKRHYREKHKLHVYQVYKLVDKNEDVRTVLAIKSEELEKMSETLSYSLNGPSSVKTPSCQTTIIKSDPYAGEIYFEEERMQNSSIQYEIMNAVDNISTEDIKVDDDHTMTAFFSDLLRQP